VAFGAQVRSTAESASTENRRCYSWAPPKALSPRWCHGQGKPASLVDRAEVGIPLARPGTLPAAVQLELVERVNVALDPGGVVAGQAGGE
jgi:hypothetical protein